MNKKLFCILLTFILSLFSTLVHAEKITVLLDWFANPDHAPLFVAEQQGFFKAQGLDVQLIGPADPSDPPKLVAAGKADIAITYQPQFMEQIDQGLPLIRIGTLIDKPLNCLVVLNDSPIKTIADLKGKRVGYSAGGITSIELVTMLQKSGLTFDDIQHINVHYDLSQALLSRKVDAVTGMMRTFEPLQLALVGQKARVFLPEDYGVPAYSELVLVINKNKLQDPRYVKFMIALQQGVAYLQKNPEISWQAFAKAHPELNDELNHQAWFATLPYFAKHPSDFNSKEWLIFGNYMYQHQLLKEVKPITAYAVKLQ